MSMSLEILSTGLQGTNSAGEIEFYTMYEYDEKGNRISIKSYDKNNKLLEFY
jgi:hypothetical protein